MYAVIRTGGKQYRVEPNDRIAVDRLAAEPGSTLEIGEVLVVGDGDAAEIGTPLVGGASVKVEVLEQTRSDKIVVFKKKRRQNYRRKAGHRQDMTLVRIAAITGADGKTVSGDGAKPKKAKAKKAKQTEAAPDTAAQGED